MSAGLREANATTESMGGCVRVSVWYMCVSMLYAVTCVRMEVVCARGYMYEVRVLCAWDVYACVDKMRFPVQPRHKATYTKHWGVFGAFSPPKRLLSQIPLNSQAWAL